MNNPRLGLVMVGLSIALSSASAQRPAAAEVNLTASSANVTESGTPVKIRILRWSNDEERNPLIAALTPATPVAAPAGARANPSPAAGGRGGQRGARGRGDIAPPNPIVAFTAAIGRAPTLGYIWTNDVTGYSIKYAWRASLPGGGERIILATDRRLGAYSTAWKPVATAPLGAGGSAAAAMDYEFTLLEMRLDAKGFGEGKASLTTRVIPDNEARTPVLENYAAAPAILRNVRRQ